ncbi:MULTISPECIES: hypothetical protein [Streptomyces]|uniref:Uncharacterized protein n=2 Tax=Streptomyces rimosus subsp. rimosus TaxID=132474 RepID=L8EZC7_STRR1|nr:MULTISPECIES: hypothetical protein [Streptomyces]KOG67260.1 hypothetical protein ADK78_41440 [Kitasatospora aureofaciens]MYT41861.1 hypothetical protein [Streptomyces sp. SID5471]KUJ25239.1 hypothetical protein ADK46_41435 [Streptomyces rimosus subsp. rimosus]QDA02920.1 hypothetical protein CTZ40_03215 [Streptomyces rimosus]QEV74192.1 hypothetical protein CP984_03200 [Streptomyces rimosus]
MNGGERRPAFGLSFDPRALTDLLQAPGDVRDLTLAYLQEVVNAERFGLRLTGDLEGYRKLFVDSRKDWRVVYGVRPAPEMSAHQREIHVVAVRPRAGNDVYDEVGRRLGMNRRPLSARTHAARARSPQLTTGNPAPRPLPSAMPGLPRPAHNAARPQTR